MAPVFGNGPPSHFTENKSLTVGNSSEDGGVYVLVSLGLAGSGPRERELEKYQGKVGWKIL
jgi:hypothetical protein